LKAVAGVAATGLGTSSAPVEVAPCSLRELLVYFLQLGTFGFGGPIALVGYMQRDLVEERRWISKQDYVEGLALAQLAPGPLAAQLAIYLGWVRAGTLGATLVATAFILPSFVMVMVLSALYLRFGGLPWMEGAFYGIGAAVIALIGRSAYKLARTTIGKDRLFGGLFVTSALITAWTESEIAWIFLVAGVLALVVKAPPAFLRSSTPSLIPWPWLVTGLHGSAPDQLFTLLWYFGEAGAFVFGSGLAIVPFLHAGVVNEFHWLTERQFVDAVAVAMITPGPVVITVAFIGYLVAGPIGGVAAAIGVFLPCYLFVVIPATYFRRWVADPSVKAFVDGVTAAAAGAIAGAAFVLGRRAIVDFPTAAIAATVLLIIVRMKNAPEPVVIAAAGAVGLLIQGI
jgi:chromate transporter